MQKRMSRYQNGSHFIRGIYLGMFVGFYVTFGKKKKKKNPWERVGIGLLFYANLLRLIGYSRFE